MIMNLNRNVPAVNNTAIGPNTRYQNQNQNQHIFQVRLRMSQSGVEMLDFVIPLGFIELHCSCPIPDEGTDGAPLYVHVKRANPQLGVPRRRRVNGNGNFVGNGNGSDEECDEDLEDDDFVDDDERRTPSRPSPQIAR